MLIGREKEQALLQKMFKSKKAEFLAIYGRRRIGKTFLIDEFFKDKGIYFEMTGSRKATKKQQLINFYKEYNLLFPEATTGKVPTEWSEAFDMLKNIAKNIDPSQKFVIFLDELPWLATARSGFLSALDYAWNRHLSRLPNVLLIICGSAAAWMIDKVVNDKGGLHGRLSAQIRLEPFTLYETEQFLSAQNIQMKRKQLVDLYMAVGGVAKYLSTISPGKSSTQIINELCFSSQGALFTEFPKLYASLFDNAEKHIAIVRTLAKKMKGMDQEELLNTTGLSYGGGSTEVLHELEESGFIMSMSAFGKHTKERQFRLMDEYSLFYLTWIESVKNNILRNFDAEYWHKMCKTPLWRNWAGHAFENVCLKHSGKIKERLGLSGITTKESHWRYVPAKKSKERGAEIDLVIDRADDCINLCEIKFCDQEYEIDQVYADCLERKRAVFQKITGTKKTVFLTMITPYGVKENDHYIGLVDQQLTLDALF